MSLSSIRTRVPTLSRAYAYRPRAVSLTAPKESRPVRSPDVPAYHALLRTLGVSDRLDDKVAVQVFTHKSHRHGAEGYNEKLAFLGRRVLEVRVSEYLLARPTSSPSAIAGRDVDALVGERIRDVSNADRVGRFALRHEPFAALMRWKARDERDPVASGQVKVASETLLALIGALELQAGALSAKEFVTRTVIPGLRIFEDAPSTTA
ncbi:Putative uncharacterized protein [Taphrina deformans PYCC 5710]|uniref:RNase III domain-containing protein n=1 Tax=Taphrina deformans (strain PYCC 5710 / ATCC 11124 / CBS 356.35 / IMI 108563 / JCM 9778 / NBRC 8474) TaxID=1097556 RepID=R4X9P1_TAPDE|nr:Putative uncharacterized protein [Taphrina deformans PYCC 5710]|eukprot:CCG80954.1 Putative uncharacterized protein [Taphrina deformans PYCC 5710]